MGILNSFMGPMIGIDYGTRRIGLAVSDHAQKMAFPADVIDAAGSPKRDAALVAQRAAREGAVEIVVGMPLNMDGSRGPQAELTQKFIAALARATPLPVRAWDERLSSFAADQVLAQAELTSGKRRRLRDALAAQVMLQSYLDAQRAAAPPADPPQ